MQIFHSNSFKNYRKIPKKKQDRNHLYINLKQTKKKNENIKQISRGIYRKQNKFLCYNKLQINKKKVRKRKQTQTMKISIKWLEMVKENMWKKRKEEKKL